MEEIKRRLEELREKWRSAESVNDLMELNDGLMEVTLDIIKAVADRGKAIDRLYSLYEELQRLFYSIDSIGSMVSYIEYQRQISGIVPYEAAFNVLENGIKILEWVDDIYKRLRDGDW